MRKGTMPAIKQGWPVLRNECVRSYVRLTYTAVDGINKVIYDFLKDCCVFGSSLDGVSSAGVDR